MSLAIFLFVILLLAAAAAALLGRRLRWPAHRQVWATVAFYPLVFFCVAVLWAFGIFSPLQRLSMQWKVEALKKALYIGETRSQLEHQFGARIPVPEHRGFGYEGTDPSLDNRARASHFIRYYYVSSSALCFAGYEGLEVQYDAHDRIRGWKSATDATGC